MLVVSGVKMVVVRRCGAIELLLWVERLTRDIDLVHRSFEVRAGQVEIERHHDHHHNLNTSCITRCSEGSSLTLQSKSPELSTKEQELSSRPDREPRSGTRK